ncbi:MAG: SUMF1/EgtB/PvdO family nonheme iron enzyme [Acidiferrobacteraceae bacterium]
MNDSSVTRSEWLAQLGDVQRRAWALVSGWDDEQLGTQYHRDLSPIGWHLGHMAVVECYWLCEVVGGIPLPEAVRTFYFPETSPKTGRGSQLPSGRELLAFCQQLQAEVRGHAQSLSPECHELLHDDYLWRFLLQHHWQHIEIMQQIRHQRVLAEHRTAGSFPPITARRPNRYMVHIPSSRAQVGAACTDAFDNEQEPHEVDVDAFSVSARPVSNAEYLQFIRDGGYETSDYWDTAGWTWRQQYRVQAPMHWRLGKNDAFYAVEVTGAVPLTDDLPVFGLSYYEAKAFSRYAKCRLPHEIEWECAAREGLLEQTGHVWEWCANPLYGYHGFRPFPYDGYSVPWMDGQHIVLRGGSRHTGPMLKRPSFRNFYTPDKRHVFAGLRLAEGDPGRS